jgi:hypothetical protein
MHIPLALHLFIHFILAVFAGFLVGRHFGKVKLGIIAGVIGGFLIDVDHILEYFFTFGLHFNFIYFIEGRQFLISNKILLIFHAWEYIPVLLIIAWLLRRRRNIYVFLLALTLGGAVHLVSDCLINGYSPRNYSLIYRLGKNFNASYMLSPAQQELNAQYRQVLGL